MGSREVETVLEGLGRYNRRDVDGFLDLATPEFEWHSAFAAVEGGAFRGREAVREYFLQIEQTWEVFELRPQEAIDAGDGRVLLTAQVYGKGQASGVEIDTPIWVVFWFRDGKGYRGATYLTEAEARQALSES